MGLKRCLTCGTPSNGSRCPAHARGGSTRQWRTLREQILARDCFQCRLCGHRAEHVDHVVPVSRGGTDSPGNLRATCAGCNLGRRT